MVLVFIGSRANYGRLKMVIAELKAQEVKFGIILGSYDIPEYNEYVVLKVDNLLYRDTTFNMVTSVAIVAQTITNYLANSRLPKLAIVHGDRFENLGFAIACSYNNVKLLHTEGGEDSGNIDDKIRNAITALADIHCVASLEAYNILLSKGVPRWNVYFTGSPAIDYVKSLNLTKLVEKIKMIVVLYNPCQDDNLDEFLEAVLILAKTYNIMWVNPNIDPGFKVICKEVYRAEKIEFIKDLNPEEYYKLIHACRCLLGNTSSGIKEGAYLGLNYVLVGNRQQNREIAKNVLRVSCKSNSIVDAVKYVMEHRKKSIDYMGTFGTGEASKKILSIIKEVLNDCPNTI